MTITTGIVWTRNRSATDGARLCEPQQAGRTCSSPQAKTRMLPRGRLRVADPRSGARLCEAQHCPQFSRCPRPIRALAAGNTAAGRRPALRDGRFMQSPEAFFSAHWDHEPVLRKSLNDE